MFSLFRFSLICSFGTIAVLGAEPARAPNILMILADDLGIVDINGYAAHFTGAKPAEMYFETPNLDRLMHEGMSFSQAYACPLCSPTRASLLTGRYAAKLGFMTAVSGVVKTYHNQGLTPPAGYLTQDAVYWGDDIKISQALLNATTIDALPAGLPSDAGRRELTFAEALSGYTSYFLGKWHVGGHGSIGYQPGDRGFKALSWIDEGYSPFTNWRSVWDAQRPAQGNLPLLAPGNAGENCGKDYLTDELTEQAVRTIRRHAEKQAGDGKPFLMHFCHLAVHTPYVAPESDVTYYKGKATKGWNGMSDPVYAGMMARLDASIGKLMATLEETGLAQSTLVVFMSDNGGINWTASGHGLAPTNNAPFTGGKAMVYEGGIRVPLICRWPGKIPADSWCTVPVAANIDLFPTFIEVAHEKIAEEQRKRLDGNSLVSLFADPNNATHGYKQDTFYWHYPLNVIVPSPRDGLPLAPHSAIRRGDWKLIWNWSGEMMLYDIAHDPYEKQDLASAKPDLARELFIQLNDWIDANVEIRYTPALNPKYDSTRSGNRIFVDLRRKFLGDARAIRTAESDPRMAAALNQ